MRTLRVVLSLDGAVLLELGVLLLFMPGRVATVFHFGAVPRPLIYVLGLWGCALLTLGVGYLVAGQDPMRHILWVQMGVARGALECLLGIFAMTRGVVTFNQAGVGTVLGGLIMVAYLVCYPRGTARPQAEPAAADPESEGQ